jgi:flagellar protein FlaJ
MKATKKIGKLLLPLFPSLEVRLKQAEIRKIPSEYLGKSVILSLFLFVLTFCILFSLNLILELPSEFNIFVYLIPLFISLLAFFYNISYPSLTVSRRVNDIEKNLLFSLRHLLVEIKSGINIYDAFLSISKANYGAISREFEKVIKEISVGVPDVNALEELMIKNPNMNFRRVIWQIINAIKSGANLGNIIEELVKEFSIEQKTKIRMYGSQLNSLALVYMIFAIVLPSIGVTFLMILSFFSGFGISQGILILIFIFVIIFQFLFIGLVKSKRPKIE